MKNGFFLGAGFSKAIHPPMPLMAEIPLELEKQNYELWDEATRRCKLADNFELSMDFLSQNQPWLSRSENASNRAVYFKIIDWLADFIEERQDDSLLLKIEHSTSATSTVNPNNKIEANVEKWVLELVRHWLRTNATLVTFNYDVLIEGIVDYWLISGGKYGSYSDCYPVELSKLKGREGINTSPLQWYSEEKYLNLDLIKLHGSINWVYDHSANLEASVTQLFDAGLEMFGDPIFREYRRSTRLSSRGGRRPMIVPPTFQKGSFYGQGPMRYLWEAAAEKLQFCDRIYFVGYSLPETDLTVRHMLNSSILREQTEIIVVNSKPDALEHYKRMLNVGKFPEDLQILGEGSVEKLLERLIVEEGGKAKGGSGG